MAAIGELAGVGAGGQGGGDGLSQEGSHLGASQGQHRELVLERQQGEVAVPLAPLAGRQVGAHAPNRHQRKIDRAAGQGLHCWGIGPVEFPFGNQRRDIRAVAVAAVVAGATGILQLSGDGADHRAIGFIQRRFVVAVDDAAQARILIHGHQVGLSVDELARLLAALLVEGLAAGRIGEEVVAGQQAVVALAILHLTLAVETYLGQADGLGVGARLHYTGLADAIRVGHQLGVLAGFAPADIAKIAEQAVRVAADDGIDTVDLGRQRQIPLVADVG